MKRIIYILLLALLITACKTRYVQVPVKEKVEIKVTEMLHDTTIVTAVDSTWYRAWIECQDGKPIIKQPVSSKATKGLEAPKVTLTNDGLLAVDCEKKAEELFFQWKSQFKETITEKEVPIYIEKPLSRWQSFILSYGTYAFILSLTLALFGAYKILKK